MRLSKCHQELTNGVGKCSVPMWCDGLPAGFCDNPAYSEITSEGKKRYSRYVGGLACYAHGGIEYPENMILQMDGNMWCATYKDFINLQESIAGFGETKDKAIQELVLVSKEKVEGKIFHCELGLNHCVSGDVGCERSQINCGVCEYYFQKDSK